MPPAMTMCTIPETSTFTARRQLVKKYTKKEEADSRWVAQASHTES